MRFIAGLSVLTVLSLAACGGDDEQGDPLTSERRPPTESDSGMADAGNDLIWEEPIEPEIPTDFALSVGPRMSVCDHPYAGGPGWSNVPCHIVTATWQGIDDNRAHYNLVPWPLEPLGRATLPMGPSPYPHVGTSYSVTFAARPAQDLCVALSMYNQQLEGRGPVEACVLVPAGDGEVVPTTVERPPMTTFASTTTTTIELPTHPLPSPLPAPTEFTLTVGELQETCTHPYAHRWTTPCYIVTATWQHLDDNRMLHNLIPSPFDTTFDPASVTLPIGPDRYPRTETLYSVTLAARPAQHLCVGLRGEGSELVEACVDVP